MRFISTKAHAILDYLMGAVLIAAPWIFGFAAGGYETWIPVVLGAGVILYSLFTDYEYSISRNIAMRSHLWIDGFAGGFLAASPWIFGFADFVFLPHLILGLGEIGAALFTETVSSTEVKAREHREGSAHRHTESHA